MSHIVLIVENDAEQGSYLSKLVIGLGYEAVVADNCDKALKLLHSNDQKISAVLLNRLHSDRDGLSVMSEMKRHALLQPVIMLVAPNSLDTVVDIIDAGAFDFVVTPISYERLSVSLGNAVKHNALVQNLSLNHAMELGSFSVSDLFANAPEMEKVSTLATQAANHNVPVFITGERGTGKEMVARAIHGNSKRSSNPFVVIDCASLNSEQTNLLLFGHFSEGIKGEYKGKIREAHNGTLLLKNITALPLSAQAKLLNFIEEGQLSSDTQERPLKLNVRIIANSSDNILEAIERGLFREDLYYRISVYPINIPSLRHRIEDLNDLSTFFMLQFSMQHGRPARSLSPKALSFLARQTWNRNVTELRNLLHRTVLLCDDRMVDIEHLEFALSVICKNEIVSLIEKQDREKDNIPANVLGPKIEPSSENIINLRENNPTSPFIGKPIDLSAIAKSSTALSTHTDPWLEQVGKISILTNKGVVRSFSDIENDILLAALEYYDGNLSRVAKQLKLGRSTLYRKLEKLEKCA